MFGKRKLKSALERILRFHDGDVKVVGSSSKFVLGEIEDVKRFLGTSNKNKPEWYKKARRADVMSVRGCGLNETMITINDSEEFTKYSAHHLGNRQLELIGALSMLWYEGFIIVIDDKKGAVLGEPGLYRIDNEEDFGRLIKFISDKVTDKRGAATQMLMSLNRFNTVNESTYPFNTLMIWADHPTKQIPSEIASPDKKYWVKASKNVQIPCMNWIEDDGYSESDLAEEETSDNVDDTVPSTDNSSEQTINDICKEMGLETPIEKDFQPDSDQDVVEDKLFS